MDGNKGVFTLVCPAGNGIQSCPDDHAKIRDLILQAERSHTTYEENFDQILSEAVYAFIWHASEEETVQLPKLTEMLTVEQNDVSSL